MVEKDHLDGEVSGSGEITETGFKGALKSRTIASLDRLVGSVLDIGSAHLEGFAVRKRAKNDGEKQLIEAVGRYGIEKLSKDEAFADGALSNYFEQVGRRQLNKKGVAAEALADLRDNPPTDDQSTSGPQELSGEFADRLERYAEDASTDELRHRWGRVLAAEIRRPGTFSRKVMRATDELEPETARMFEEWNKFRVWNAYWPALMRKKSRFTDLRQLIESGLMMPNDGTYASFDKEMSAKGREQWVLYLGDYAVGIATDAQITFGKILFEEDGKPSLPMRPLTDVGYALTTILPSNEQDAVLRLGAVLHRSVSGTVVVYKKGADSKYHQLASSS
jgi:hypothetical protein